MTSLNIELPPELYDRLRQEAERSGKPADDLAREWLAERLGKPEKSERELATEALRRAGLLTELSPKEKERARRSTATLEEVRASLDRAGGKPLSEIVLEQRRPKE